jgi:hypothetical protein
MQVVQASCGQRLQHYVCPLNESLMLGNLLGLLEWERESKGEQQIKETIVPMSLPSRIIHAREIFRQATWRVSSSNMPESREHETCHRTCQGDILQHACSAQRETLRVLLLIECGTTSHVFLFSRDFEVTFSWTETYFVKWKTHELAKFRTDGCLKNMWNDCWSGFMTFLLTLS